MDQRVSEEKSEERRARQGQGVVCKRFIAMFFCVLDIRTKQKFYNKFYAADRERVLEMVLSFLRSKHRV